MEEYKDKIITERDRLLIWVGKLKGLLETGLLEEKFEKLTLDHINGALEIITNPHSDDHFYTLTIDVISKSFPVLLKNLAC